MLRAAACTFHVAGCELGFPRGSKYQIFNVSGPKSHTLSGIWGQSPKILGVLGPSESALDLRVWFRALKCRAHNNKARVHI